MRRGGVDDAAPAALLHAGHGGADAMEGRRQVDGDDLVPLLDREFLDRRHELDAGVVDEHVDRAEVLSPSATMAAISAGLVMSAGE